MVRPNPHRPFVPNPEMVTRLPEITGNEINGLGETLARRPDHVFWAPDPNDIAFGECRSGSICASLTARKWPPKEPKDKQFLMPLYLI